MKTSKDCQMFKFIHQKNVERFRKLSATIADENQRKRVLALLAEEEAQQSVPEQSDPQRQK
jgi:hypothetical protein